jgi:GST-like protein
MRKETVLKIFAFATPNSVKVPIALEELGLEYELVPVNVRKGEQKLPSFIALNANSKVPVLVDPQGPAGKPMTLTESGAILIYLAEKTGRLLPTHGEARSRVFEQLFFQGTGIGPALGQSGFFQRQASEVIPLAIARFGDEAHRTLSVLNHTLSNRPFTAGDEYSIADIAHFGWMWRRDFAGIDLSDYPNVARWYELVDARPAVSRALERVTALVPPQA